MCTSSLFRLLLGLALVVIIHGLVLSVLHSYCSSCTVVIILFLQKLFPFLPGRTLTLKQTVAERVTDV